MSEPKLTQENFSIAEMTECSFAERLGIKNEPSLQILGNLSYTVSGLEKTRTLLGYPIHVNSGFRHEELERFLCKNDYHDWCERQNLDIDYESLIF